MRRALRSCVVAALAAVPGCASINDVQPREILDSITEFLGQSNPSKHVRRLVALHDTGTFRHDPDLPPTYDACVEEVRILGGSDYGTWRDVAVSTFFVTRVAVDDQAALNRGEAVRALVRLGGMVAGAEDPPEGAGAPEKEVSDALQRLRAIHGPGGVHDPPGPETAGECAALVHRIGDLRLDDPTGATTSDLRYRLGILRGFLNILVATGLADEDRSPEATAAVDRTVINIAAQAARLSLLAAARSDERAEVRAAAADALGAIGAGRAIPGLAAALRTERTAAVRREAVQSLGVLAGAGEAEAAGAVPSLLSALEDDDRSVRFNAREALAALAGKDLGEERAPWIEWWVRRGDRR